MPTGTLSSVWSGLLAVNRVKTLVLTLAILLIGFGEQLYATHIVGGDISYRCLGNNRYEITLTIYRDCEGGNVEAGFDNPASVGIFDSRGNLLPNLGPVGGGQLLMYYMGEDTLTTGLNPSCIDLDVPICVHRAKYVATVTLPFRPDGYILAHQRCCRNATVSNIVEPLETGATYTARITERALQECNQGAVVNQWPPVFICFGEELVFDHSATDADGDQIVYRLCTPLEGATRERPKPQPPGRPPYNEVVWAPGFSEGNMMGSAVPITIDPNTGILRVTPDVLGQFVIGVCIEEYRNGELISATRRDFQFNVIACGEVPFARFNAPDLQCGDLTVEFENVSVNGGYYEWYFDWPNEEPTLSTVATEDVSFTFPDTGVYQVALLAYEFEGSACVDTLVKTINLRNTGLVLDYEITKLACGELLNLRLLDSSTDSVAGVVNSEWIITYGDTTIVLIGAEVETQVPAGVTGTITLTVTAANECTISETVEFEAVSDIGLIPDFEVEIIKCEDEYRVIPIDLSRDDEGEIISWTWVLTDQAGNSDTLTGQVPGEFVLNGFQNVTLSLRVVSTSECDSTLTRSFDLIPTVNFDPRFELNASECEDRLVIDFLDRSYDGPFGSPVSWNWTILADGELVADGLTTQNITLEFDSTVVLTITLCVTYELDGEIVCENTCTTEEIKANLLGPDTFDREVTICEGGSIQLNPNPLPGVEYTWSGGLTGPSPVVSPEETTVYSVTITDPAINCSVVKEVTVNVVPGNDPMDFEIDNECGSLSVTLTAIDGDPSVVVKWTLGDGATIDSGDLGVVDHTYAAEGTYTICMFTEGDCPMEICKEVSVRFIDLSGLQDTIVNCEGDPVELYPGADPAFQYTWEPAEFLDDANAPNPTATVTSTTTFNVTITDPNDPDCVINRSVTVAVPDPITLDVDDVVVLCEPEEVIINASSPTAVKYTWRNGAGEIISEDSTLVDYVPQVDEVLTVTVEDIYGCETTKSVSIEFFKIVFTQDGNNPMCVDDIINITATAPDQDRIVRYTWSPTDRIISGGNTRTITVSPPNTTNYQLEIEYDDGCVVTGNYLLQVADFPENFIVTIDPRDTIIAGNSVTLSVTPCVDDYTYVWEPSEFISGDNTGCTVTSVILDETVDFTLTVINMANCSTEVNRTLTVANLLCEPPFVYLPNTFSPNGDSVNDVLRVLVFDDFVESIELIIYSRWGQEVFKTTSLNFGWDGTFNGKDMPVDAYGYYLRVVCQGVPDPYVEQGKVNLVR